MIRGSAHDRPPLASHLGLASTAERRAHRRFFVIRARRAERAGKPWEPAGPGHRTQLTREVEVPAVAGQVALLFRVPGRHTGHSRFEFEGKQQSGVSWLQGQRLERAPRKCLGKEASLHAAGVHEPHIRLDPVSRWERVECDRRSPSPLRIAESGVSPELDRNQNASERSPKPDSRRRRRSSYISFCSRVAVGRRRIVGGATAPQMRLGRFHGCPRGEL